MTLPMPSVGCAPGGVRTGRYAHGCWFSARDMTSQGRPMSAKKNRVRDEQEEELIAPLAEPLVVNCGGCAKEGTTDDFYCEEGERWECQACWERSTRTPRIRIDPRTITTRITRAQFASIPLRFVLTPVLDGPVLAFHIEDRGHAEVLSAELDVWRELLPRSRSQEVIKRTSWAARHAHKQLVALAVGYTWPGNPPGYIQFSDA